MRLVQRPCRKLLHSGCEGDCRCACHSEEMFARLYGPPFPRPVPDGTVKALGGEWVPARPPPPAVARGLVIAFTPWTWRHRLWWRWNDLVLAAWRWRDARAAAKGPAPSP